MTNVAQNIVEETIKLTAADGHSFEAFHAAPKGASKGGLVILQEIFGLTDQLKGVVRAYARDGYDTIFPCVYDRVAPGTVVPFAEAERGRDLAYGLPLDKVMLDVGAAVDRVQSSRGVSVLGFCWGGGVIVRAAAELNLRGAIAFYGTRLPTYLDLKPKCPLLFHFGKTDPNSTPEMIEQVGKAFPSAETHVYEAGHAFANDVRPAYNEVAATTARARTLDFWQSTTSRRRRIRHRHSGARAKRASPESITPALRSMNSGSGPLGRPGMTDQCASSQLSAARASTCSGTCSDTAGCGASCITLLTIGMVSATSPSGTSKINSSCTCSSICALSLASASSLSMRIMARRMMSAADPCKRALIAARSLNERIDGFDALMSG
jgi:carboxymethylenebutenolidase